jgi:diacylglycerol kinase (ATP)
MEIRIDGQILKRKALLVAVGNGQFYGGGMRVLPTAKPDDGLLDVCIAGNMTRSEILRALPRLYRGTHPGLPKIEMLRAKEVSITSGRSLSIQVDGEVIGQVPAVFRVEPGALKVAVPRTSAE